MAKMKRFEDLEAWQHARALANAVYDVSDTAAFAPDTGLRDQLRRTAVSIMAHIAEGFESRTIALYLDSLGHAKMCCGKTRSILYLTLDRQYLNNAEFERTVRLAERTSQSIYELMRYLAGSQIEATLYEDNAGYDISGIEH